MSSAHGRGSIRVGIVEFHALEDRTLLLALTPDVERAKARSLIEAIAGEAEQKARAAGFELGGITQYVQDERENLPRLRFEDIQAMLAAEAEGQGKR